MALLLRAGVVLGLSLAAERPFSSEQGGCLDSHSARNGPSPQSRGGAWISLAEERPFYSDHSNPDADHSDPDSDRSDSEADHSNPDADQDHDQGGFLRQDPESEWDDHNDPLGIRRETLAREWLMQQMGKVCSDTVSNTFFDFAVEYSDVFMQLKATEGRLKLRSYRKRIIKSSIPEIRMDYVLEDVGCRRRTGGASGGVPLPCLPEEKVPGRQVPPTFPGYVCEGINR